MTIKTDNSTNYSIKLFAGTGFLVTIISIFVFGNFVGQKSLTESENYDGFLLNVISPNGGEIWEPGTTEFIKWSSQVASNLKIEYSTDNGINWNLVYSNVSSIPDSISWIIPNTPSQHCLIKITDVNNLQAADTSDYVFTISSGGWIPQFNTNIEFLSSIHFLNNNLGFCIGDDGSILKTTTGGLSWDLVDYTSSLWIISIRFANEDRGVVVGYNGFVKLTTNSGNTWQQIDVNTTRKLNYVTFADETKGWIMGDWGNILTTSDGGFSWQLNFYPQNVHLYSASFIDTLTGWVAGQYGTIGKTTDGGRTWISQYSNPSINLYGIDFVNDLSGWAVGGSGTILHTTTGGTEWIQQISGTTRILETVEFVNKDSGWVGGWYGTILSTKNEGNFWSKQQLPSSDHIQSINFPNQHNGWLCIEDGWIFKYSAGVDGITVTNPNGGERIKASSEYLIGWFSNGVDSVRLEFSADAGITWQTIASSVPANELPYRWQVPAALSDQCLIKVSSTNNPGIFDISNNLFTISDWGWFQQEIFTGNDLNSIFFISPDTGWITGNGGIIFSTSDGGNTWQQRQSNSSENLNSVYFNDYNYGWASGNNGTVLLSANGGMDWTSVYTGTNADLKSVFFIDQLIGWASGSDGKIIKSINGGMNWSVLTTPDNYDYQSIFFINSLIGYAVDDFGFIIRTTNGGNSWNYTGSGRLRPLYSIFFPDQSYGYSAGTYGVIKRTSNAGVNWIDLTEDSNRHLRSIHFTHSSTGWTVGVDGIVLHTTNHGDNWYEYSSGTSKRLNSVFFTHPNTGWVVGTEGTLLKYFPQRIENINLLTPNGGENWQHGSTYVITWISNDIENLRIEYSTDNGYSWQNIIQSIPASIESFSWLIPNTPSLNCLVKLTDTSDETIYDLSDTVFAISSEEFGWFKLPIHTNYILSSVHFVDENVGWVVGNYGNILKTTDGGYNWINQFSGTFDYLTSVEFENYNTGWVFGIEGTILKTTNGGLNWFSQQDTITSSLISASFTDVNNGWVLSYYGKIFHTTNGGNVWSQQYQLPSGNYYTIKMVNPLLGWISCNSTPYNESIIYKTTNGGESWIISFWDQYTPGVKSISFADENFGFGVGIHGVIMRTTNSGYSWVRLTQGFNNWLNSIHVLSQNLGWAVGNTGTILHTQDGNNWVNQVSGTDEDFRSIYMVNNGIGYIVSEEGNIYKTNSGGFINVEIENFLAEAGMNEVKLSWNTVSETNNLGFEIQRRNSERSRQKIKSSGGGEQETGWGSIGFVGGYGTTTEIQYYFYTDESLQPGSFQYRLKQIDFDGSFEFSDIIQVEIGAVYKFSLSQNYPNPFNPTTKIKFTIPQADNPLQGGARGGLVTLKVYDILGNEIATLVNEEKPAGEYEIEFSVGTSRDLSISSGIYFYQLRAGDFLHTKKMILLK
jgi:photosystem II stability/assembly factor-like uncharacterized protein